MPLVLADRVQETTTTTGTGTVTLLGAATGFQSFAVIGNGNTTYYCIAGQTSSEWEVGIGTYTSAGTTLARTTVLASSNAGSLVNFSAGTKNVFVTYPAGRSIYADGTTLQTTNSAVLPVASGGTGLSSTPSNGQLNIGNGTGFTRATLTGTTNQITVTNGAGSITLALPQNINTAASVQFGSFGVGTAASGTTGEIRATNNVTAYYSSDARFKENVVDIPNAASIACGIGGKLFDWTDDYLIEHGGEDGYFIQKEDFGVIAQDVQRFFPRAVRIRPDGSLAVDYEKLSALALAAVREQDARIAKLEAIVAKLTEDKT